MIILVVPPKCPIFYFCFVWPNNLEKYDTNLLCALVSNLFFNFTRLVCFRMTALIWNWTAIDVLKSGWKILQIIVSRWQEGFPIVLLTSSGVDTLQCDKMSTTTVKVQCHLTTACLILSQCRTAVHTVVRVTQQVSGKGQFGVSELRNPWTDWLKIWHTWLCRWVDLVRQIS